MDKKRLFVLGGLILLFHLFNTHGLDYFMAKLNPISAQQLNDVTSAQTKLLSKLDSLVYLTEGLILFVVSLPIFGKVTEYAKSKFTVG